MVMGSAKSFITTHQPAFRAQLAPTFTHVSMNIYGLMKEVAPHPSTTPQPPTPAEGSG